MSLAAPRLPQLGTLPETRHRANSRSVDQVVVALRRWRLLKSFVAAIPAAPALDPIAIRTTTPPYDFYAMMRPIWSLASLPENHRNKKGPGYSGLFIRKDCLLNDTAAYYTVTLINNR